ncbi:MAG: hypothetical protein AABY22_32955 [Nanoarchaeota archaeon]
MLKEISFYFLSMKRLNDWKWGRENGFVPDVKYSNWMKPKTKNE